MSTSAQTTAKETKWNIVTLLVIFVVVVVAGFGTYWIQKNASGEASDSAAHTALDASEETPYTDMEGNPVSFDAFAGQVRVVNTWASWCPFCVAELKDFELLASEYAQQGVIVIAVNRMEDLPHANAFLKTLGDLNHLVLVSDKTDAFYQAIGGFSMPETIFYDSMGEIVVHKRGFMNLEEMRMHVETTLNSPSEN